jgi:hypothetical protein
MLCHCASSVSGTPHDARFCHIPARPSPPPSPLPPLPTPPSPHPYLPLYQTPIHHKLSVANVIGKFQGPIRNGIILHSIPTTASASQVYHKQAGEFRDQGDAEWIVITGSLWGHNDTPCGRPASGPPIGRPGSCRQQGKIGGFGYY